MAISVKLAQPAVKVALKAHQLPKFDHKVKTINQPKVKVKFDKEIACRGQLYEPGKEYDLPLDLAHSLGAHLAK